MTHHRMLRIIPRWQTATLAVKRNRIHRIMLIILWDGKRASMTNPILITGAAGGLQGSTGRQVDERCTTSAARTHGIPSAQAWFAGGERIGYDPNARAILRAQGGPLNVFLRREGDLAHAVSFLPGFPDGSFGWARVLPHLPNT